MKILQKQIRGLWEDNDLTQAEIAEVLGTSQTMYARYERGANEMPIRHLVTLCKFYNVSANYFLDTAPDPRRHVKIRKKYSFHSPASCRGFPFVGGCHFYMNVVKSIIIRK